MNIKGSSQNRIAKSLNQETISTFIILDTKVKCSAKWETG